MLKEQFNFVKGKNPVIHNITNYVTANDCANILLALGASPIMADEELEAEEVTSACDGLNINIGTLNKEKIYAMIKAGKKANALSHPVLLGPVGIGASTLRKETVNRLLDEVQFTVIRGNISEIKTIAMGQKFGSGVDASFQDRITEENLDEVIVYAKELASRLHCVINISGVIDLVCDEKTVYVIRNGHSMMASVTGTGCMSSSVITAFLASCENPLQACAAGVILMGVAGEAAYTRMKELDGNAGYRNYLIDAIYNMTPELLEEGANYEVR